LAQQYFILSSYLKVMLLYVNYKSEFSPFSAFTSCNITLMLKMWIYISAKKHHYKFVNFTPIRDRQMCRNTWGPQNTLCVVPRACDAAREQSEAVGVYSSRWIGFKSQSSLTAASLFQWILPRICMQSFWQYD
jgi:hypothetical protein